MLRRRTCLLARRGGGNRICLLVTIMRLMRILLAVLIAGVPANAQTPVKKKHILVIGQTKGFEHDSVPDAMGSVWKMGRETGLWDTYLRTDTELLTKGKVGPNGKNLDDFNLVVFASTTGELDLTDQQKKDLLAFVHDDGKGFVGIHAAL